MSNGLQAIAPPLKWAGGKRWLIERLRKMYDRNRRLVDPFVGGASIPLGLRPDRALFSDINPHLMNFYRLLQQGLYLSSADPIKFENDATVYYDNRERFNILCRAGDPWTREGALLFYYLNRTCFNGLCRFNDSGEFNTPFGKYKSIRYTTDFRGYAPVFSGWTMYSGDFESLPLEPGDFLYADPPYDVEFTKFAARDFTWPDQERLVRWLAAHQGPVVASNQATERIAGLYYSFGFSIYFIDAPRTISSDGNRTPAKEILALRQVTL
jgi:DNA adenine methylase